VDSECNAPFFEGSGRRDALERGLRRLTVANPKRAYVLALEVIGITGGVDAGQVTGGIVGDPQGPVRSVIALREVGLLRVALRCNWPGTWHPVRPRKSGSLKLKAVNLFVKRLTAAKPISHDAAEPEQPRTFPHVTACLAAFFQIPCTYLIRAMAIYSIGLSEG
jgi:hypothetical protein